MLIPVILSGGAGTRLWPVSREGYPKPFLPLPDGHTLLQKTIQRACALKGVQHLQIVTNREYYFITRDNLMDLPDTVPQVSYVLEPFGRNTAPAVLLSALELRAQHGDQAIMLVLAADHLIEQQHEFAEAVDAAMAIARCGHLVTFGIRPDTPHTGYGYIELGEQLDPRSHIVTSFKEKPALDLARAYVESGLYVWNSGMFCFSVGAILASAQRCAPELYQSVLQCWEASRAQPSHMDNAVLLDAESLTACRDVSIDYAIMEKADNVAVVPVGFDWSDVGAWDAVSDLTEPDADGNRIVGEAITVASHNCYIRSHDRLVAAVGIEDIMVVDTPDALLVCSQDSVQQVKEVVARLKANGHESFRLHRTVHRPWGTYTVLEEEAGYKIKRIEVKPGASLSLQMHHHRSEHWIVVSGTAHITNNDTTCLLRPNESTYIKAGHRHRLENPGVIPLVIIEVQSGEYLGEDDIVRFVDNYGRQ